MAGRTEIDGDSIQDGTVQRKDLDITTSGQSLVCKVSATGEGITLTSTGADVGTGDVTIELDSGGFGTDYYSFESPAESTTTSNNWVVKNTFSTPSVISGKYVVHYKALLTCSTKKTVGFRVRGRFNGGTWVDLEDSRKAPTTASVYETRAAFGELEVTTDSVVDIEISFGQTTSGGTGKIKDVIVYLFKVGEI